LLCLTCNWARALDVEVARFDVVGGDVSDEAILSGTLDRRFELAPGPQLRLPAGVDRVHWLRLSFTLPLQGDAHESPQVLGFDRVALERIRVYMPQPTGEWEQLEDSFFEPGSGARASLVPESYAFAIPHHLRGPQIVYVALQGASRINLTPQVQDEAELRRADREIGVWLASTYASILVLMLSAIALFLALRDRAYLHFSALTAAILLLLLAINGHLYRWPGLTLLAAWRNQGIYALALACCGLALGFAREFLDLSRLQPTLSTWMARARVALFGIAVLCLLLPLRFGSTLQMLTLGLGISTALFVAGISFYAWRRGETIARAYCLVWIILAAAIATRAALAAGWVPQQPLTLYGFQVAVAFCLFLTSIGLADRVMEFRRQRDQVRQQKAQTDASLQVEQVRRQLLEALRERSRSGPAAADLEWFALRRVLASLAQLLPQRAAAIVAFGYHGSDLILTEPMEMQAHYTALIERRGGALKTLCRSQRAQQLSLEEPDEGAEFGPTHAVIPMQVEAPAWGALLIERAPGESFSPEELALAAEFLELALGAADEAASQAELRRKAEIDPLTGASNRHAGDAMLDQCLRQSLTDRQPFTLLFVDLDHFKHVNDRYGHAVGDECLRRAAATIRSEIRVDDVLVRYGGEEFLVILPGLPPELARQLGERIRSAMMQLRLQSGEDSVRFTVSIGVAGRLPGEDRPGGIVERADEALYTAKRNGRNQVQVASTPGFAWNEDEDQGQGGCSKPSA
jgi:diguanylate cyclase (GGDEF)-like protein